MRRAAKDLLLILILLAPVAIADDRYEQAAREVGTNVQDLCAGGRYDDAERLLAARERLLETQLRHEEARLRGELARALARPDSVARVRAARRALAEFEAQARRALGRILFTKSYLLQCAGRWEDAASMYAAFLAKFEDHDQAVRNRALVLAKAQGPGPAVSFLEEVAARHPERTHDYALLGGDLLFEAGVASDGSRADGLLARSAACYDRAAAAGPDSREARARLLDVFRQRRDPKGAARLFLFARAMEREEHFDVAFDGYATVVSLAKGGDDRLAAEACVGWAHAAARLDRTGAGALDRLPLEGWDHECARQMHVLFETAAPNRDTLRWWTASGLRAHTAAAVLHSRSRRDTAIPLLRAALDLAPGFAAYRETPLDTMEWIQLDIARDLARAYLASEDTAPQVDGVANRFQELEGLLFEQKGLAIRSDDVRAMQHFHTTLALLYTEMDPPRWGMDGRVDGALFQLRAALRAAERRTEEGLFPYQPLPRLRRLLADGYMQAGAARDAVAAYVDAAEAYLDADDLRGCSAMLAKAGPLLAQATGAARGRHEVVRTYFAIRARIERIDADAVTTGRHRELAQRIRDIESPYVSSAFRERQCFKALTDLGARVEQAGSPVDAAVLMAEGVTRGQQQASLTSYRDVHRLRTFETSVRRWATFAGGDAPVSTSRARPGAWSLATGATRAALGVDVSDDLETAGRLIERCGYHDADGSWKPVPFEIARGKVVLRSERVPDERLEAVRTRVRSVPGVEDVRVDRPGRPDDTEERRLVPFALVVDPASVTVEAGGKAIFRVRTSRPATLSVSGVPNTVSPRFTTDSGVHVLTLATTAETRHGTYHLTVRADTTAGARRTRIELVVEPAAKEPPKKAVPLTPFTLVVPKSVTVRRGGAKFEVSFRNAPAEVSLDVSDLPYDCTWTATHSRKGWVVTLAAGKKTPRGRHGIRVLAESGSRRATADVVLIVE